MPPFDGPAGPSRSLKATRSTSYPRRQSGLLVTSNRKIQLTAAVLLLFSLAALASATCPNLCSGNGLCQSDGTCQCFTTFDGSDCSLRKCWHALWLADRSAALQNFVWFCTPGSCKTGTVWVYKGDLTGSYATTALCSGVGSCNTATGICSCLTGFAGDACEKSAVDCLPFCLSLRSCLIVHALLHLVCAVLCPNMCSGHGSCVSMTDAVKMNGPGTTDSTLLASHAFGGRYCKYSSSSCVIPAAVSSLCFLFVPLCR